MGITAILLLIVCVSVVDGAALADNSCEGRCGPGTDNTKPCQCNTVCVNFGDCCHDYQQVCLGSCKDRCGFGTDSSKPCQCNPPCVDYGDCCSDYQDVCNGNGGGGGSCDALTDVSEYFWSNDINRLTSSQYSVNWQSSVSDGNTVDRAPSKFFTSVDEAAYTSRPTFTAFVALLDNYNNFIGSTDFLDSQERAEMDTFYNLIRATPIFDKLYEFLLCQGRVSSESDFRSKFYNMWFDLYPRSSSSSAILDSSGFEHVMVGELRVSGGSKSVSGFHSWIQFYEEERIGRMNYYGYVRRVMPDVAGANFAWRPSQSSRDAVKSLGSFFIGSSPEFDLALYTLCAFEFSSAICNVRLGGTSYRIQTWDVNHKSGLQIGSAYPAI
ncbi:uridylate-specific endoribonuclease-like isoform X2 [Littorina saxatilis]|uniref:uridylate-specific endoribonuclease-like isoform X2 n=1 Tax=Littorina saxatilis TaxID=31220 RepID=UPI0038B58B21